MRYIKSVILNFWIELLRQMNIQPKRAERKRNRFLSRASFKALEDSKTTKAFQNYKENYRP